MLLTLKNKYIRFKNYKIKCALGKKGTKKNKKEGDKTTPKGRFKMNYVLYRSDRVKNLTSVLKKKVIKKNMGWCDDPSSDQYNKLIKLPFKFSAEKIYRKSNIYDIIIVINYNLKPIIKSKGSAVFIHISKKNFKSTEGCIAISKKNMRLLLNEIKIKSYLNII